MLAIFREARKISRQQTALLEAIERLKRRGDYSEDEQRAEEVTASPNKLLAPAELAQALGRSREFVYRHADKLGAVRLGEGEKPRLYFDLELARDRLAALAARNGAVKSKPKPRRRRRQRNASTELLPVKGRAA